METQPVTDDILNQLINMALKDPIIRFGIGMALGVYILRRWDGSGKIDIEDIKTDMSDVHQDISAILEYLQKQREPQDDMREDKNK